MDPLPFGLIAVDQMNGGRHMKQLAEGWSNRAPRRSGRLRRRVAVALIALSRRLAPETLVGRPVVTGHTLAGSTRS